MSRRARRMITYALLVGALPMLTIACPFIFLKLTVKNETPQTMTELNVSPVESGDWGDNALSGNVESGGNATVSKIAPGDYDVRAIFTSKENGETEVFDLNNPLTFGTLNICVTYTQYTLMDAITVTSEEVL